MKSKFLSKRAKAVVDIAMIAVLIIALACSDPHLATAMHWRSSHCIIGVLGLLLITVHVMQHWRLINSFTKKRVILKNKITALMIMAFILMSLSILLFIIGFSSSFLRFHNIIGHLFGIIVIIHTIDKFKRLIR